MPRQVVATDCSRALVLRVAPGSHVLQILTPAGVEAQLVVSSEAVVELGDEAILCEKVKLQMLLERGKAPPLQSGKDILWLRRALSVTAPTRVFVDLRVADPALRDFAQLMLVNTSTGDIVEAADQCLGPVMLQPSDAPYMLLVRSVIGTMPEGYDIGGEGFVCPWLLRFIFSSACSINVKPMASEFVLDANGYYVRNLATELFRYAITPPEAPAAAEGEAAPAGEPVYMTVQLRTNSPALVDLYLLQVKQDQVWSQALEMVDPIAAICNASMERDGKITCTPLHLKRGLTSVMLPVSIPHKSSISCFYIVDTLGALTFENLFQELRLLHKAEHQYMLLARLIARQPPVVLKRVLKEAAEEALPDNPEGGAENGEGEGGEGGEKAPRAVTNEPEMVAVTNVIEEPGEEPFWTLRIFSTAETSENLIKPNVDKYAAMDAFIAECRESGGREAFKQMLAKEAAASGPVSAEASQEAPASEPAGGGGDGEEGAQAPEPWPPVKTEEQTWGEYLSEYRTSEKLKAGPILVKRDPGDPSKEDMWWYTPSGTIVQPPEFWIQQEQVRVVCVVFGRRD